MEEGGSSSPSVLQAVMGRTALREAAGQESVSKEQRAGHSGVCRMREGSLSDSLGQRSWFGALIN